jgi:uncharacterized protein YndB with AHSA1/START domain
MNLDVNTKMKISKSVEDVFDAFVNPAQMANYWFTGTDKWEQGKTITLKYIEYNAQVDIKILELEANKKIVFQWGATEDGNVATISLKELDASLTIIEVNETGFKENDDELISKLLGNKEGWVYMLTCLKGYLEYGAILRASLVI